MNNLSSQESLHGLPVDPRDLRRLLERISASRYFKRSRRLVDFLNYICDRALTGRFEDIHEQKIGSRVFGRRDNYDTGADNIVRVEARELRQRLEAYFEAEGESEPVVITVPKGAYVPVFARRDLAHSENGAAGAPEPDSRPGGQAGGRSRLLWALGSLVIVLATSTAILAFRNPEPPAVALDGPGTSLHRFWQQFFRPGSPVLVCVADSNFALLQDLRKESASFEEYASGSYFSERLRPATSSETNRMLSLIASRRYTSVAEVAILSRLLSLDRYSSRLTVRSAREVRLGDLRGQNVILTGSYRSNPWAGVFANRRNFAIKYDVEREVPMVINKNPLPGEPAKFVGDPVREDAYVAYGIVAYLANLDRTGHVLILAGTNMEGTQTAGELMTSPDHFEEAMDRLGLAVSAEFPEFEVVVKLATVGGSSISSEIIAARLAQPAEADGRRQARR